MDLNELLARVEDKTLEFKRDASSPLGILRTVVAFANSAGGVVLIGVEDATRHVRGVVRPLDLEERLASLISDSISPRLVPGIEVLPWRRLQLVAIEVYPSPSRPHHIVREGPERGTYVRVGSTNRRADDDLIRELRRSAIGEGFDEQPVSDANSEAIDFRAAAELFADSRKLTRKDLETLRILVPHQGRLVPSVGGLVLLGHYRLERFPDAWIQAGRFAGLDRSKIIDSTEIRTVLPQAAIDAVSFVQKHAMRAADIGPLQRRDRWSIPVVAVREAVINAIVHADYSQRGAPIRLSIFDDRLEVESPGLLPVGVTVADLHRGISKLRNRVIGRVFHELGLIEQWGSGIQRMTTACREAGLPDPVLEEIAVRFRVTVPTTPTSKPAFDPVDQSILAALTDGPKSTSEIAALIGRSQRTARNRLAKLVERGNVRETGMGPTDPRRRYTLSR